MTGIFHGEVVGSLLRPRYLSEARTALDVYRVCSGFGRQFSEMLAEAGADVAGAAL